MIMPGMYFYTPYQPAVSLTTGLESKSTAQQYQPMYTPPTVNSNSADQVKTSEESTNDTQVEDYKALSQTSRVQPPSASPTAGSAIDVFV